MEIKDRLTLEKPNPMKNSIHTRNKNKFCQYHEEIGHDTNNGFTLQQALDRLADNGMLKFYISKSKGTNEKNTGHSSKTAQRTISSDTYKESVYTIAGGFSGGGPTIRGTKDHLKKIAKAADEEQASANRTFPNVLITKKDQGSVRRPHDDPVFIECKVTNQLVGQILIDTCSSSNIISYKCLQKLKYKTSNMHPVSHPLVGFGGGMVYLVDKIDLPIRLGDKGEGWHLIVKFLVVEAVTAYNIILGRPTLNKSKAVIIPSLMLMKYERDDGSVGSLNGDLKTARECYLLAVKPTLASSG
ncbi:uncharacterized protein LOC110699388 [Chenopodium quinoa]|uniref:uncharacterized protein LOC110699388 n=1 Tax=Chenopodium quinoa TaxID=63459 RepID=UPI000B795A2E|nr:uncharacterized protein LOC110699388 [Chenopodium quinoa]